MKRLYRFLDKRFYHSDRLVMEPYALPRGFETKAVAERKRQASIAAREKRERLERLAKKKERQATKTAEAPFVEFWNALGEPERERFLTEALQTSDRTKRDGYLRLKELEGPVFEQYRQLILKDHFHRISEFAEA